MKKRYLTALMTAAFVCTATAALAQFTLSAQIRPRAEFRSGFKKPLNIQEDPAFFTEQRTRFNLTFAKDRFSLYVSAQDVRVWGAADQVYKNDPALTNLYEAWAAIALSENWKIKIGRQALDYDNARILGNLDWAQQGRSHDLALAAFEKNGYSLHAGAAFNQDARIPEFANLSGTFYTGGANYKTMQFLWAAKKWDKRRLSFLMLNDGRQGGVDTVNFTQTAGFTFANHFSAGELYGEAYFQTGRTAAGRKTAGWLLSGGVKLFTTSAVALDLGVDWLSGDKAGAEKLEAFDPLYGTHHKFYGFMDYFYVGSGHQNKGLIDFYLKSTLKAGAKSKFLAHLHRFYSDQPAVSGADLSSSGKSGLGYELDLIYQLNVTPEVAFIAGYSQFLHSDALAAIKEVSTPQNYAAWAWASLNISTQLFTTAE